MSKTTFDHGESKELLRNIHKISKDYKALGQEAPKETASVAIAAANSILAGNEPSDFLDVIDVFIAAIAQLDSRNQRLEDENDMLKLRLISM